MSLNFPMNELVQLGPYAFTTYPTLWIATYLIADALSLRKFKKSGSRNLANMSGF